ncbi:hypothetical protein WISP_88137 [Willisornis vidua]|uniref:Uncharacterized protein n=1 Tax=Willisornis vidua TaxID=1566151 RepID=A0ABQ9D2F0_9PASS|nr:hypothetical protein WISP_88137 [Willisornis vidua]
MLKRICTLQRNTTTNINTSTANSFQAGTSTMQYGKILYFVDEVDMVSWISSGQDNDTNKLFFEELRDTSKAIAHVLMRDFNLPGNSQILEIKQARQKVGLAEQEYFLEKRQKRKVYAQWKQGQVTWEEYRDAACHYREKIRMAKAQLELKLDRNVGTLKRVFFKYINGNRQYRNTTSPSLDEDGHLKNRTRDKAGMFNAFFDSVFNMDDEPRRSQYPELEDHDCKNDQLPVNPEIVWDLLLLLDPCKSMGPHGIHPRILKELADVITKFL